MEMMRVVRKKGSDWQQKFHSPSSRFLEGSPLYSSVYSVHNLAPRLQLCELFSTSGLYPAELFRTPVQTRFWERETAELSRRSQIWFGREVAPAEKPKNHVLFPESIAAYPRGAMQVFTVYSFMLGPIPRGSR